MFVTILTLAILVSFAHANTAPGSAIEECGQKPVELFFLLDSSSSIWSVDFKKQLKFVNKIIDNFDISPNSTRVGIASFSFNYRENIGLESTVTKEDLQEKVRNIRKMYGGTYTNVALDGVRESLSNSRTRPGVPRIAFVLTDGQSRYIERTEKSAKLLKNDGITVFAIGVGGQTKERELKAIASEPSEIYMYKVGSYGLLDTIKSNITQYACQDVKEKPTKVPFCGNNNAADIMFLVEPSGLGYADSLVIYDFIGNITDEFNTANGNIRIGVESQICPSGDVIFRQYDTQERALKAFGSQKYTGLGHMIKRLRTDSYKAKNGGRKGIRRMAVLFVDDKLDNTKQILDEARRSKNYKVDIYVVAIGDNVIEKELKTLCSSAVDRHYIHVPSYEQLHTAKQEFLDKFCHGL